MDLEIVSYSSLYGWTMDEIVAQIGNKNNCTYCGVFRRQALDRGAVNLGIKHIVTGHNADDMAETILMNMLRGDTARLDRCTEIVTDSTDSPVKRSKPLKYTYEKRLSYTRITNNLTIFLQNAHIHPKHLGVQLVH